MFNNPFMYANAGGATGLLKPAGGIFSGLKAINWGNLLSNTQKTLGIINQTIPIIYQVKPIVNNARTMLKVASSLKEGNSNSVNNTSNNIIQKSPTSTSNNINYNYENKPMFFI